MVGVTIFLVVLIVSLVIGNVLLFFVGNTGRKSIHEAEEPEPETFMISPQPQSVNLAPLEKKVELAHKRIQIIERQLEDSTSKGVGPALKRRIEKLDNFRSTVEAELIGVKEILMELQNKNVTVKSRSFKSRSKSKGKKKLSPKKLHNLVYRSG